MDWFYANERDEQVPVGEEELKALAESGGLRPETLVWNASMTDWKPCREVKPEWFLAAATTLAPSPYLKSSSMAVAASDPTPTLPNRYRSSGAQQTDGLALASLICGISGLVFLSCYLAGLPISIAAVICGHLSRQRLIREGNTSSAGLALAGLITGYISIGIAAAIFLFVLVFVGFAAIAAEATTP
ncbi:MAG: DUF4339 domain-containing protein [Verrucomicrobiae bacterium]|nr:DUF4339 domain-containing protein [Verrucomicrobiae bacterium]